MLETFLKAELLENATEGSRVPDVLLEDSNRLLLATLSVHITVSYTTESSS